MNRKRRVFILCCCLALILGMLTGCSAKAGNVAYDQAAPEADREYSDVLTDSAAGGASKNEAVQTQQKLIRTLDMDAETEALDELLVNLESRVNALGGYIESKEVYRGSAYAERVYRHANLTIRIPAGELDSFVSHVGEVSNITSTNESSQDVTLQYIATESRILALETEQTRLLELLEQAETMEDLLLIESRLTDVRTELEEVASQKRLYDNLVDYSTINLYIGEVQEYTPVAEKTFWQRIADGFIDNLKALGNGIADLFVFLITGLPFLIPLGIAVLLIVLAVKKAHRKRKQKNAE